MKIKLQKGKNLVTPIFTSSWDDGDVLDFRLANLLKKYDLQATFYIPFESSQKVLTSAQIREISSEFDIGAHTMTHVRLINCTDKKAEVEISSSKKYIEDITGKTCFSFCFPGGEFTKKHLMMVSKSGFRGCRSVELLNNRIPQIHFGIYLLPTTIQVYSHTTVDYLKNIYKRKAFCNLANLYKINSYNWFDSAKLLFIETIKKGGIFHLWGHSWEIEEMNLWSELEKLISYVSGFSKDFYAFTNSDIYEYFDKKSI